MKFLVVDDSKTMIRIVSNTLTRLGYTNIVTALDGQEAWDALSANQDVNVILTDWDMPNVNGLQFVKMVRADERYKDIPIAMITTESGKGVVITALKAGVSNYIVKPFTPQVLKEKLSTMLGLS